MTTDSLEYRVKTLVTTEMAVWVDQLTPTTRLLHDLGADGDDGWDLMAKFGRAFGVDMSEFRFDVHFGSECGANPIRALVILLCRPKWARFIPITIADLVEAAQSGRWKTPAREPV